MVFFVCFIANFAFKFVPNSTFRRKVLAILNYDAKFAQILFKFVPTSTKKPFSEIGVQIRCHEDADSKIHNCLVD